MSAEFIIDHVEQTEAINCVSACFAMVLKRDIDVITNEFDNAYHNQEIDMHEYLGAFALKHRRCMAAERKPKAGHIYIMCVPSLNMALSNHALVVEMDGEGANWRILDPNNGREGREFYGSEEHPNLVGWVMDFEFKKSDVLEYWEGLDDG